jgi:hypothetical protein
MPLTRPLSSSAVSTHSRTSIVPVPSCILKEKLVVPWVMLTTLATKDTCGLIRLLGISSIGTRTYLSDINAINLEFGIRMCLVGI